MTGGDNFCPPAQTVPGKCKSAPVVLEQSTLNEHVVDKLPKCNIH